MSSIGGLYSRPFLLWCFKVFNHPVAAQQEVAYILAYQLINHLKSCFLKKNCYKEVVCTRSMSVNPFSVTNQKYFCENPWEKPQTWGPDIYICLLCASWDHRILHSSLPKSYILYILNRTWTLLFAQQDLHMWGETFLCFSCFTGVVNWPRNLLSRLIGLWWLEGYRVTGTWILT